MKQFNKPENLNGEQLVAELNAAGVFLKPNTFPLIDGNGNFWLDVETKDVSKTETVVSAHVGIDTRPAKIAQRQAILDRLGLTNEEMAILLS